MTFSTDRSVSTSAPAMRRCSSLPHLRRTSRSLGELRQRRFLARAFSATSPRRLRVDPDRFGDGPDRARKLLDVLHAFLQQIRAGRRSALEECERVARLRIRAQHDHTPSSGSFREPEGGLDASSTRRQGGHAMSVTTTSGLFGLTASSSASRSPQAAGDLEVRCVSSKRGYLRE